MLGRIQLFFVFVYAVKVTQYFARKRLKEKSLGRGTFRNCYIYENLSRMQAGTPQ